MKKLSITILCACLLQFMACARTTESQTQKIIVNQLQIKKDQKTYLYGSKATARIGDLTMQPGDNLRWKGSSEVKWLVEVMQHDQFNFYLNAWVPESSKDMTVIFSAGSKTVEFQLQPTKGLGITGRDFQRVLYSPQVELEEGTYEVALKSPNVDEGVPVIDFRALELEPVSAVQKIRENREKAIASRASTEWLRQTGYGLMFHWTSQSVNPDGISLPFDKAVNNFDVLKFADMVEETGAGYVIFTIGHAEQYCPAPIESWEKCHPGQTTQRDLIMEIANELEKRDVRLMLYMHSLGTANFKEVSNEQFFENFKLILGEFGLRYKEKIVGYWFDCWYQIFEGFPEIPFEEFFHATKVGNKDRIIALNSWIYPSVTPWQEYWAGEVASPVALPENGYMKNGPVPDLPYQALLIMEPYWVQQKAEMPEPRFNSEKLGKYIQDCMNNGGAVTINLGIYQDGTVGEKALQVMKEVKNIVRKGN